mmetsp:Transcript_127113/g.353929  ORF Transcript_127113/g.353929 Transcript_127113/m.353929 type:complete len:325 (-) Transcript_127113:8-982(-)
MVSQVAAHMGGAALPAALHGAAPSCSSLWEPQAAAVTGEPGKVQRPAAAGGQGVPNGGEALAAGRIGEGVPKGREALIRVQGAGLLGLGHWQAGREELARRYARRNLSPEPLDGLVGNGWGVEGHEISLLRALRHKHHERRRHDVEEVARPMAVRHLHNGVNATGALEGDHGARLPARGHLHPEIRLRRQAVAQRHPRFCIRGRLHFNGTKGPLDGECSPRLEVFAERGRELAWPRGQGPERRARSLANQALRIHCGWVATDIFDHAVAAAHEWDHSLLLLQRILLLVPLRHGNAPRLRGLGDHGWHGHGCQAAPAGAAARTRT